MILHSVHPGVLPEEVIENTGWDLKLASKVESTKPPTRPELRIIRKQDAHGFWTRGSHAESRLQERFSMKI
jgi:hypothetical protein